MEIRKIAKLAHLEITDDEVELYTPQMANIVAYVEKLNELDTSNVVPMLGGLTEAGTLTKTIREDVPAGSFKQSESLAEAPASTAGHFQVPKVLG